EAWRAITAAVHQQGGRIYAQLWHTGRVSHAMFHGGQPPVAPSALTPAGTAIWAVNADGVGGMIPCGTPRALETGEIATLVDQFRQ
ncbi:alkene reductase, partial [Acinetobacter baumannii]